MSFHQHQMHRAATPVSLTLTATSVSTARPIHLQATESQLESLVSCAATTQCAFFMSLSSPLCEIPLRDGSSGKCVGGATVGSTMALHVRPRNPSKCCEKHCGLPWGALWPCLCVPRILKMRGTARALNDTCKYGQYCEVFFFLMQDEPE